MKVALDYDGTYTADPVAWAVVVNVLTHYGHEVFCVTMRRPDEAVSDIGIPVHYTEREAKLFWCARNGITVDVWIDDNPGWIVRDAAS